MEIIEPEVLHVNMYEGGYEGAWFACWMGGVQGYVEGLQPSWTRRNERFKWWWWWEISSLWFSSAKTSLKLETMVWITWPPSSWVPWETFTFVMMCMMWLLVVVVSFFFLLKRFQRPTSRLLHRLLDRLRFARLAVEAPLPRFAPLRAAGFFTRSF